MLRASVKTTVRQFKTGYSSAVYERSRYNLVGSQAGNHNFTWDAYNVASGMYIYMQSASQTVQSKKMILIKWLKTVSEGFGAEILYFEPN